MGSYPNPFPYPARLSYPLPNLTCPKISINFHILTILTGNILPESATDPKSIILIPMCPASLVIKEDKLYNLICLLMHSSDKEKYFENINNLTMSLGNPAKLFFHART